MLLQMIFEWEVFLKGFERCVSVRICLWVWFCGERSNEAFASRGDDIPSLQEPPKLGKLASGNAYCGLDKKITKPKLRYFLVRETGLEPVRRNPHAPQTCASANSATLADCVTVSATFTIILIKLFLSRGF